MNCIVLDEETADHTVYIATDLGVYYTNDNLNTWQLYGVNLPNVIVGELEIHQGEDKIYAATFGRGIWVIDAIVGLKEEDQLAGLDATLYPNPNAGEFSLQLEALEALDLQLEVIDVMGRIVAQQELDLAAGSTNIPLQFDLAYGQYYLKLSNGNRMQAIKFVVN